MIWWQLFLHIEPGSKIYVIIFDENLDMYESAWKK